MAESILGCSRQSPPLLAADVEHFTTELLDLVRRDTPFDLLVPLRYRKKLDPHYRGLAPEQFTPHWAGFATASIHPAVSSRAGSSGHRVSTGISFSANGAVPYQPGACLPKPRRKPGDAPGQGPARIGTAGSPFHPPLARHGPTHRRPCQRIERAFSPLALLRSWPGPLAQAGMGRAVGAPAGSGNRTPLACKMSKLQSRRLKRRAIIPMSLRDNNPRQAA